MESSTERAKKRPGRPLSFDREKALDKAIHQFWRTGYETTSVADLVSAMGITTPSLYTAFGDKEALFLECVERYSNSSSSDAVAAIAASPSARQAAQDLLEFSAKWFTQPKAPAGCLIASAASSGSEASAKVRAALAQVREISRKALQNRAERDIREGRLPKATNARALASSTIATLQGMSTLARDGANRIMLQEVVQTMMAAWPESAS